MGIFIYWLPSLRVWGLGSSFCLAMSYWSLELGFQG